MKPSVLIQKLFKNKLLVFLVVIFVIGAFLRFYHLEARSGFDADQEELAFKAQEILHRDPALLGPTTSLGRFAIGPGFSYLWAGFSFVTQGDPAAGAYLSVFLGLLTVVGFYLLGKYLFNEKVGVLSSLIYAFSLIMVTWDQNPWAPSLFFLSELFLLFGAYMATKKSLYLTFAALGLFLGFQSHFGIFLVVLAVLAFWIFYKPKLTRKSLGLSFAIVLAGFLPNIIYDLANNFVNTKRLLEVFGQSTEGGFVGFDRIVSTISYSFLSILKPYPDKSIALLFFLLFVVFSFVFYAKKKKQRAQICLLISTILVPALLFMIFKGSFSEYYLMMTIPSFILLLAYLLTSIFEEYPYILATLVLAFSFVNISTILNFKRSLSLKAKKQAVSYIVEKGGKEGYGVSLTTQLGYNFGYKYIFNYYKAAPDLPPLKDQRKIFTIVSPDGFDGVHGIIDFDGVGVLWEGIN